MAGLDMVGMLSELTSLIVKGNSPEEALRVVAENHGLSKEDAEILASSFMLTQNRDDIVQISENAKKNGKTITIGHAYPRSEAKDNALVADFIERYYRELSREISNPNDPNYKIVNDNWSAARKLIEKYNHNEKFPEAFEKITGQKYSEVSVKAFAQFIRSAQQDMKDGGEVSLSDTQLNDIVNTFLSQKTNTSKNKVLANIRASYPTVANNSGILFTSCARDFDDKEPDTIINGAWQNNSSDPALVALVLALTQYLPYLKDIHKAMTEEGVKVSETQISAMQVYMSADFDRVINAINAVGGDVKLIKDSAADTLKVLKLIFSDAEDIKKLLTQNNKLLSRFAAQSKLQGDALLAQLISIKLSVKNINGLMQKLPADIANELEPDLTAIKDAIEANTDAVNTEGDKIDSNLRNLANNINAKLDKLVALGKINATNQAIIIAKLSGIMSGQVTGNQLLTEMLEILELINQNVAGINDQLAEIFEQNEEALGYLKEISADTEEMKEVLYAIKDAIEKLGIDGLEAHFTAMLKAIKDNGVKLDDLKALLNTINNNVVTGNKQDKEYAEKILKALSDMGFSMTSGMTAILNAVLQGNKDANKNFDALLKIANKIYDAIKALAADNKTGFEGLQKTGDAILEAITGLVINPTVNVDLSGLEDKMDELIGIVKEMKTQINTLVGQGESGNKLLKQIYDFLTKMELQQNITVNIDINVIKQEIQKIVEAVTEQTEDIGGKLDNIDGRLDGMAALMAIINNNVVKGNDWLKKINDLIDNYGAKFVGDFSKMFQFLADKKDLDAANFEALMAKLNELLAAIKDHDVNVEVKVEGGKCECHCTVPEGTDPGVTEQIEGTVHSINELLAGNPYEVIM